MIQNLEDRLRELIYNESVLIALENGGVDNWEWYSESINDFVKTYIKEEKLEKDDIDIHDIVEIELDKFKRQFNIKGEKNCL